MKWKKRLQKLSVWPPARRAHSVLKRCPLVGTAVTKLTSSFMPPDSRIWVNVPAAFGKELALYLDPRFEMHYATGKYELPVQQALSAHVHPGAVVYDVGAHIGIVSMFCSQLVGPTGHIFAFEADPENAKHIETHLRRNRLSTISVVPCAVWSSERQLRFARASAQSSRNQGRVRAESTDLDDDTIVVEATTLDNFMQTHLSPTLIKIDVEGGEAEVLRGAEKIFSRSTPVVLCEVHDKQAENDVRRWLADRRYSLQWLESSGAFPRHFLATPRRHLQSQNDSN
jgi:FkbM family methyltransferase